MTRILAWGTILLLQGLGLVSQTVPERGFFEDGNSLLEVKTFHLATGPQAQEENAYVAWLPDTRQAVVIDPGAPQAEILEFVRVRKLKVLAILNTHGHADHSAGDCFLAVNLSLAVYIHPGDRTLASRAAGAGCVFASYPGDGRLVLDGWEIDVIPTPGHTPGSICLRICETLFSGDTLFAGTIGRAEPPANLRREVRNIRRLLLTLPPTTRVFPGHGPATTIGAEKNFNPYLSQ